ALVDISTLNANVMWELGVRHALKPRHTIMICEKEQMSSIPFDIHHFVVHQYTHTEEGIPHKEVERFKTHLTGIVTGVLNQNPQRDDSPVFTYLENELMSKNLKMETFDMEAEEPVQESFADLLKKAEEAKDKKAFKEALALFSRAKTYAEENMSLRENLDFIISRMALCTYKSKHPNELEALVNAKIVLQDLKPHQSNDVEVLGLTGAINKRLYELTQDITYLDHA